MNDLDVGIGRPLDRRARVAAPLPPAPMRTTRPRIPEVVVRTALQVLLVVVILGLWEAGVRLGWISAFLFGAPWGIAQFAVRSIANGSCSPTPGRRSSKRRSVS